MSAYPYSEASNFGPEWLKKHSGPLTGFEIVCEPHLADLVLFVENHPGHDPYFRTMLSTEAYRRFPDKCVLYHDADATVTFVRTISPSIGAWQFISDWHKSVHYVARLCENDAIDAFRSVQSENFRYLFSFIGSVRTHPVRAELMRLQQADGFVLDTSGKNAWEMDVVARVAFQAQFAQVCSQSAFVLCQRGIGPASYRLFEAMQMGRVPVIVSDDWVPPEGVDWPACSIRVREKDVENIPAILRCRQAEAAVMGVEARRQWENSFSPNCSLQTLSEAALAVVKSRRPLAVQARNLMQFAAPFHARGVLRSFKRRIAKA